MSRMRRTASDGGAPSPVNPKPRFQPSRSVKDILTRTGSKDLDDFSADTVDVRRIKRAIPFWPKNFRTLVDGTKIPRSAMERLHLAFTNPNMSRFARYHDAAMFNLVVFSCVVLVVATIPGTLEYRPGCEQCKPLSDEDLTVPELVAQRTARAEECHDCEPDTHIVFLYIEIFYTVSFNLVYLIKFVSSYAAPCLSERKSAALTSLVNNTSKLSRASSSKHLARQRSTSSARLRRTTTPQTIGKLTFRLGLQRMVSHFFSPASIVDLIANISDIYSLVARSSANRVHGGTKLSIVRLLRVFRLMRMFRTHRFVKAIKMYQHVMMTSINAIATLCLIMFVGILICSALGYYAEQGKWHPETGLYARPEVLGEERSPFTSIPQSFWWVIVTFASVGYGDMVPQTWLGQMIGALTIYTGILLMALPIAVLNTNYVAIYFQNQERKERKQRAHLIRRSAFLTLLRPRQLRPMRRAWNTWWAATFSEPHPVDKSLVRTSSMPAMDEFTRSQSEPVHQASSPTPHPQWGDYVPRRVSNNTPAPPPPLEDFERPKANLRRASEIPPQHGPWGTDHGNCDCTEKIDKLKGEVELLRGQATLSLRMLQDAMNEMVRELRKDTTETGVL